MRSPEELQAKHDDFINTGKLDMNLVENLKKSFDNMHIDNVTK